MTILIFIFYLQLLFIFRYRTKNDSFLLSTIKTGLSVSFIIFGVTSFLDIFNSINRPSILFIWIVLNIISVIYLIYNFPEENFNLQNEKRKLITKLLQLSTIKKITLLIVGVFIITLFIQGITYPPTNWDSLTYHLPRIIQWINHGSLEYYPTHIVRQLYQPPFAEYAILQTIMLNKNDFFAFGVQFSYYLLVTFTVIEITSYFNDKANIRWIAGVLCLFIPEAVLQATSTQNDVVVSFFIASSILFLLLILKKPTTFNFIFLGVSIGLAFLTKALAYVYLPVFVVMFLFFFVKKNYKRWEKRYFIGGMLTLLIVFSININHFQKNYELCHNIMGTDPKEDKEYKLEDRSLRGIFSNIIKNISLHIDPFYVGNLGNQIAEKTHLIMNFDLNKKGMNYIDSKFSSSPSWLNHEDTQPNFLHLLLGFISFITIINVIKRKKTEYYKISYYFLGIIASFLLFNYLLKWQPWNTRIHLPLFFLLIPALTILNVKIKPNINLIYGAIIILIPYSFYLSIFNYSRPFISKVNLTSSIKCSDNRFKKYFSNNIVDYVEYKTIVQKTISTGSKNIGLHMHSDSWEYPLYYPLFINKNKMENILVKNYSRKYPTLNFKYNFIISNLKNTSTFKLNHYTYYNLTPNNNKIWLYKLQK